MINKIYFYVKSVKFPNDFVNLIAKIPNNILTIPQFP